MLAAIYSTSTIFSEIRIELTLFKVSNSFNTKMISVAGVIKLSPEIVDLNELPSLPKYHINCLKYKVKTSILRPRLHAYKTHICVGSNCTPRTGIVSY